MIPKRFWQNRADAPYQEYHYFYDNWKAGDFSYCYFRDPLLEAFGVEMELGGILDILPPERRGEVARAYSVFSNPNWISATEAIRMITQEGIFSVCAAQARIVEAARQGLVAAKAVEIRAAQKGYHDWCWHEREWPIPTWYWADFTDSSSSTCNFESGSFRGHGHCPLGLPYLELSGVHFLRSDLEAIADNVAGKPGREAAKPDSGGTESGGTQGAKDTRAMPSVSARALEDWWARKAAVRELLTIDELWALAENAFPKNFISRERIRALAGPRKRGPKPIGGKVAAD